ncbi:peptidase domain-containing ABC transporter [Streptomyces umbrinus]
MEKRIRIPVCFQTELSDCGPACLVMVLQYHGIGASLDEVRARGGFGRNGASARKLLSLARDYGLSGRGVRTDVDGLRRLPAGTVLFWDFNHFVVLEMVSDRYVHVVDPAFGRRRLDREAASQSFTGVALEFDPPATGTRVSRARAGDGAGPWRQLGNFLPTRREFAVISALSIALMGFEILLPITLNYLVGEVLPQRMTHTIPQAALLLVVVAAVFLTLQASRALVLTWRQSLVEKQLSWRVLDHLASLPYDYFTVHSPGDLAMRVRTSSALNQVLSISAVSAVFDSLLVVGYLAALLIVDPVLALPVIALIGAQGGLMSLMWKRQVRYSHEVLERQTRAQNELVEMLESITTLKAAGVEGEAVARWSHSLVREVNKRLQSRRSLSLTTAVSRTLQLTAPVVVLLIGAARVLSGEGSLGATLAFMTLTVALFAPLESVFSAAAQLATVRPALTRLDDVLHTPPEPRGRLFPASDEAASVTVERASFTYRGAARPALEDLELGIRPGKFVVVLGRSGSGKSTLGMLLAGLYVPDSGTIRVDGEDLAELDRPAYRRQISYVNQNAHLFAGTIRENVAFGAEDIGQEQLIKAVQLAHIHEDITELPMGYETLVSPGGHGISGGQRQRIVLARALARNPRLLILDEATSALDPALEEEVFRGLLKTGITIVAIAHRLTVLELADHVLVVREGRIVEAGSPAALRAKGGEFLCLS